MSDTPVPMFSATWAVGRSAGEGCCSVWPFTSPIQVMTCAASSSAPWPASQ
ncbi:hypothetical protein ABZ468_33030 [Streptomyces sp. NPDC005708]|uniref:hypothetical protein n=1 Tax=unclassified Streptomyces TaxID=2593676 RepID=UPI0033C4A62C